eukprot:sb/3477425/
MESGVLVISTKTRSFYVSRPETGLNLATRWSQGLQICKNMFKFSFGGVQNFHSKNIYGLWVMLQNFHSKNIYGYGYGFISTKTRSFYVSRPETGLNLATRWSQGLKIC